MTCLFIITFWALLGFMGLHFMWVMRDVYRRLKGGDDKVTEDEYIRGTFLGFIGGPFSIVYGIYLAAKLSKKLEKK